MSNKKSLSGIIKKLPKKVYIEVTIKNLFQGIFHDYYIDEDNYLYLLKVDREEAFIINLNSSYKIKGNKIELESGGDLYRMKLFTLTPFTIIKTIKKTAKFS